MNSKPKLPEISKSAFTKAREKLGLSTKDLGGMACLSTRQIEQIESGETSSFYGAQIKVTAAKKVAKLLKLSDEEAFDYGIPAPVKSIEAPKAEEIKAVPAKNVETQKESVAVKAQVKEVQPSPAVVAEEKQEPTKKVQTKEVPLVQSPPKSKPNSQKKLFLWISVAAALAFAVINLQPLFFADKPEEIIVAQEEIIEPAPAATSAEPAPATPAAAVPVVAAPAVAAEASTACPAEEGIISYKPEAPRKAADMVYVQVKSKQVVCVSDASGKMQNKMVEPGVGASFYGRPPFKVLTGGLAQADVFFQGAKVRLTNFNYKTLVLDAAEVVAPSADRADSQQR
ncbi:MAG: helix-turn-helix transcriptional regulator [Pseudomonadota bacterium]